MRVPNIVKGFQKKAEEIGRRIDRAMGNPLLTGRAVELEELIEATESERTRVKAEITALSQRETTECPVYMNDDGLRNRLAAEFVEGESFPPDDLDLNAAVGALLKLTFGPYRKTVLRRQRSEKNAELGAIENSLAELKKELTKVEYELSQ
jgi:hypothetical protein